MSDKKNILNSDRMITPEVSVFGTRAPRPTGVGKHLIVVIILSVVALTVSIFFVERDIPLEDQQKPKNTQPEKR